MTFLVFWDGKADIVCLENVGALLCPDIFLHYLPKSGRAYNNWCHLTTNELDQLYQSRGVNGYSQVGQGIYWVLGCFHGWGSCWDGALIPPPSRWSEDWLGLFRVYHRAWVWWATGICRHGDWVQVEGWKARKARIQCCEGMNYMWWMKNLDINGPWLVN